MLILFKIRHIIPGGWGESVPSCDLGKIMLIYCEIMEGKKTCTLNNREVVHL